MKIFIFAAIFVTGINLAGASEAERSCAQIMEEAELSPTEDFWMYLKNLVDDQVISKSDLESFYQKINVGEFVNPIKHQMGAYGPLFSKSTDLTHYKQLQKYIDILKVNPTYLSINDLKIKLKNELGLRNEIEVERRSVSHKSNTSLVLEQLVYKNELWPIIKDQLNSFSEPFRKTLGKNLIEESGNEKSVRIGFEILSSTTKLYSWSEIENLIGQHPQISFWDTFKIIHDDGSDEFRKLIQKLLLSDLNVRFKIDLISRIENVQDPSWKNIIENIFNENEAVNSTGYFLLLPGAYMSSLVELYSKINDDSIDQNLKDIVYKYKNVWRVTRVEALYTLIKRGYGKEIFSAENIKKLGKLKHIQETLSEDEYRDYIISELLKSLSKNNNHNEMDLIKLIYKNHKKLEEGHFISALKGRKDSESLDFIKKMYTVFPTQKQIEEKLMMLQGRDNDWVLDYVERNSTYLGFKNYTLYYTGIRTLKGMTSKRSLEMLERYYLSAKGNEFDHIQREVYESLEGRPVEDIIYFLDKYHNRQDGNLTKMLFTYLRLKDEPRAVEIAKGYLKSTSGETLNNMALDYLSSLSKLKYKSFWKQLASEGENEKIRKRALENMIGATDPQDVLFFENILKTSTKEIQSSASAPYIFSLLFYYDKSNSLNEDEAKLGKLMLEKWDYTLLQRLLLK